MHICRGPAPVDTGTSKVGMASLGKYIFNHRSIERLEMDRVVGKLVEKKRLNNLVYGIESMLQMGIQPEQRGARKNDMGVSVFLETDLISLFLGLLIYLLLHIRMNTDSHAGVSSLDLYQNQVLHIKRS